MLDQSSFDSYTLGKPAQSKGIEPYRDTNLNSSSTFTTTFGITEYHKSSSTVFESRKDSR